MTRRDDDFALGLCNDVEVMKRLRAACFLCVPLISACAPAPTDPNMKRADEQLPSQYYDICEPRTQPPPKLLEGRAPIYPVNRLVAGHDGYAVIEFDITPEGKTKNFVNVDSSHPKFYAHTKIAVAEWTFEPAVQDGVAITVHCQFRQGFFVRGKSNRQRRAPTSKSSER